MYVHYQTANSGYSNKDFMKDLLYILTGVQDDGTQASIIDKANLSASCDKDKSFINSSVYDARWQYYAGGNFTGAIGVQPTVFLGDADAGYSDFNQLTTLNAKRYDIAFSVDPTNTGWYYLDSTDPTVIANWKSASGWINDTVAKTKDYFAGRDTYIIKTPVSDNPTQMKYMMVDRFQNSLRHFSFDLEPTAKIVASMFTGVGQIPPKSNHYGTTPDKLINVGDIIFIWESNRTSATIYHLTIKYAISIDPITGAITWADVEYTKNFNLGSYMALDDGTATMAFYNIYVKQEAILFSTFVNGVTSPVSGVSERTRRSKWDTPALGYPTQGHLTFGLLQNRTYTYFLHTKVLQPFKIRDAIHNGQDAEFVKFALSNFYGSNMGSSQLITIVPSDVTRDELLKSSYQLFEICCVQPDINHEGGSISALADIWLFNTGKGEHGDTVTIDGKTYVIWQLNNSTARLAVRLG